MVLAVCAAGAGEAHADTISLNTTAAGYVQDGTVAQTLAQSYATGGAWSGGSPPVPYNVTSQQLAGSLATEGSSSTAGYKLAGEAENLAANAGLTNGIGLLGKVLMPVGAFATGYQIGSTLRTEFGTLFGSGTQMVAGQSGNNQTSYPIGSLINQGAHYFKKGDALPGQMFSPAGSVHALRNLWVLGWDVTTTSPSTSYTWPRTAGPASSTNYVVCLISDPRVNGCQGTPTIAQVPVPDGFQVATNKNQLSDGSGLIGNNSESYCDPDFNGSGCSSKTTAGAVIWADARYWPKHTVPRASTSTDVPAISATDTSSRNYTTANTAIQNELTNNPGEYPTLIGWLDHKADPIASPTDPLKLSIPAPLAHETYDAYAARLRTAGFTGTITTQHVTDAQVDRTRAPGEAVGTDPATGSQVAAETALVILTNPAVMPASSSGTGTSTSSTGDDQVDDGNPAGSTAPAVDFSPLQNTGLGDRFPFAVPGWVAGALGGWSGSGSCPTLHMPMPHMFVSSGVWDIDGCSIQPMVDVVRPVFLVGSLLGLAWLFAGAAMGFGGAAATEEE